MEELNHVASNKMADLDHISNEGTRDKIKHEEAIKIEGQHSPSSEKASLSEESGVENVAAACSKLCEDDSCKGRLLYE
jgi:hypothetical protein